MEKLLVRSRVGRNTARTVIMALLLALMPMQSFGEFVRDQLKRFKVERKQPVASRSLTAKEMKAMRGRGAENPYFSGKQKWAVDYNGVDLTTGNFSFSATDLSFEGGYGIPVNVTRTYSANNPDEGPFGKGWTLSVDIRTTAGGILKGSSAPVRSVPVESQERPINTVDPRNQTPGQGQTTEGVIATDSSGMEEVIQRDVDGILTTPPWDKNETDCTYEVVMVNGQAKEVTKDMTVKTPEGTVYTYVKKGYYLNGATNPADNGDTTGGGGGGGAGNDATPSNILKISSVADRHGNTTYYYYGSTEYQYERERGAVKENLISSIAMPNGYTINVNWVTKNAGQRVGTVTGGGRTITYSYDDDSTKGLLRSVTSPSGLMTSYGYGSAVNPMQYGALADDLLNEITDPRGAVTKIHYTIAVSKLPPYMDATWLFYNVPVYWIEHPNGIQTYFSHGPRPTNDNPNWTEAGTFGLDATYYFQDRVGSKTGEVVNSGGIVLDQIDGSGNVPAFSVAMLDSRVGYGPLGTSGAYNPPIRWVKTYNAVSQDLSKQLAYVHPYEYGDLRAQREFDATQWGYQYTEVVIENNFRGNPLSKTAVEHNLNTPNENTQLTDYSKTYVTHYAYHGKSRYYQQKAVKDPKGRFTYTDYFEDSAAQGKKGQVYRVYDPKNSSWTNSGETNWKDIIVPADTNKFTAQFDYDSKGRPIEVKKLQSINGSTWFYTITQTTYGNDNSPNWGNPTQVVEDVDQSGIGYTGLKRTTQTLEYDAAGHATKVQDAAGRQFQTDYDVEGRVTLVKQYNVTPNKQVAQYTYGTSGKNAGMLVTVKDKLSSIQNDYSYYDITSGGQPYGASGQVYQVVEKPDVGGYPTGTGVTTVTYTYTTAGDRDVVTYDTPYSHATQYDMPAAKWKYLDFVRIGTPESPKRVFQTLRKLNEDGSDTTEEFHYQYDSVGRLSHAGFMQTPQAGHGYEPNYPAQYRAHSYYVYDATGRILNLEHAFETWNSNSVSYDAACLKQYKYMYNLSNRYYDDTGLRTKVDIYNGNGNNWAFERSETYDYDTSLDYLVGADYNDGGSNEYTTWTYDAAGNRASDSAQSGTWTYNALNQMSASPGYVYENDVLGNRTWRNRYVNTGGVRYTWDIVNRMETCCNDLTGATYKYRADGMRVKKVDGLSLDWHVDDQQTGSGHYDDIQSTNKNTTRYYHDGQMGMEEDYTYNVPGGFDVKVTRYALGGRGIEMISQFHNGTAMTNGVTFPLYDGHGNMVSTIRRDSASPYHVVANVRTYDAWGLVRSGSATDDPAQRYCASLGHRVDNESEGLIYMRARYYEPWTGRFVCEDQTGDGWNWFVYANNDPVGRLDANGNSFILDTLISDLNGLVNEFGSAAASQTAKNWAGRKMGDVVAYQMGRLFGMAVAMEMEATGKWFKDTNEGFGFKFSNKSNMNFHYGPGHFGYHHIDLRGELGKFEQWFKKSFNSGIPLDPFIKGFEDGFF
ncbi:MAG: RHS repeat-associated core domain-containing protein [Fimbriimonadales bacterium]